MRRLHARLGLAGLWLVIAAASLTGGCSSPSDSGASNLPPETGKTIASAPDAQAAERAAGMARSGQAMASDQAKAAQEMAAAKARSGGK